MTEEKRARRIRERERVRERARFVCKQIWSPVLYSDEWLARTVPRMAENMQTCRYGCCQNPRRSPFTKGAARLTMQERRAFQESPHADQGL